MKFTSRHYLEHPHKNQIGPREIEPETNSFRAHSANRWPTEIVKQMRRWWRPRRSDRWQVVVIATGQPAVAATASPFW